MPARTGRILLLNGASSAGRSSIGQALPADPWFLVPIDAINVPVDAINARRSTAHSRVLDEAGHAVLARGQDRAFRAARALGTRSRPRSPPSKAIQIVQQLYLAAPQTFTLVNR